jgi:hypothetical protein
MENLYWVYGLNNMGTMWFVDNKNANRATLWAGAPDELRQLFSKEEAISMVNQLDKASEFGSTRHYVMVAK